MIINIENQNFDIQNIVLCNPEYNGKKLQKVKILHKNQQQILFHLKQNEKRLLKNEFILQIQEKYVRFFDNIDQHLLRLIEDNKKWEITNNQCVYQQIVSNNTENEYMLVLNINKNTCVFNLNGVKLSVNLNDSNVLQNSLQGPLEVVFELASLVLSYHDNNTVITPKLVIKQIFVGDQIVKIKKIDTSVPLISVAQQETVDNVATEAFECNEQPTKEIKIIRRNVNNDLLAAGLIVAQRFNTLQNNFNNNQNNFKSNQKQHQLQTLQPQQTTVDQNLFRQTDQLDKQFMQSEQQTDAQSDQSYDGYSFN